MNVTIKPNISMPLSGSTLNNYAIQQVLNLMLEQLERLAPYDAAAIFLLVRETTLRLQAWRGLDLQTEAMELKLTVADNPLLEKLLASQQPVALDQASRYQHLFPIQQPHNVEVWIGAPLVTSNTVVGLLTLSRYCQKAYTQQEASHIQSIAQCLATLLNAIPQLTPPDQAIETLAFLYEAARTLSSSLNTEHVLQMLMRLTHQHFKPDAVSVALVEADNTLVFKAASGKSAQDIVGLRLPPGAGIVGWVAAHGEILWIPDVRKDNRHYRGADEQTGFQTQAIYAVPVLMGGKTLAVLELVNPNPEIELEAVREVIMALASLAAPAIRNANLFGQVQRAEKRYQQLFDLNLDPIAIIDIEGQLLQFNQAAQRIFGFSADAVGQSCFEALALCPERLSEIKDRLQQGEVLSWELEITNAQGEKRTLEVYMSYLADYTAEGAYQWLAHDISDHVELERLREQWANMLVHDLRVPLNSILNSVELVQTAWLEKDITMPVGQILEIARRNTKRLDRLINDILDAASMREREKALHITDIQVPEMIDEVLEIVQPSVNGRQQVLQINVADNLPLLPGDFDMLRRVLTNLLENAIKFTPKNGTITLEVEVDEEKFRFTITDTGPGIPEEELPQLFGIFYRGKRTRKTKGTGIGLTFCKLAVEAHEGKIWAESTSKEGSRFTFTIPRRRASPPDAEPSEAQMDEET